MPSALRERLIHTERLPERLKSHCLEKLDTIAEQAQAARISQAAAAAAAQAPSETDSVAPTERDETCIDNGGGGGSGDCDDTASWQDSEYSTPAFLGLGCGAARRVCGVVARQRHQPAAAELPEAEWWPAQAVRDTTDIYAGAGGALGKRHRAWPQSALTSPWKYTAMRSPSPGTTMSSSDPARSTWGSSAASAPLVPPTVPEAKTVDWSVCWLERVPAPGGADADRSVRWLERVPPPGGGGARAASAGATAVPDRSASPPGDGDHSAPACSALPPMMLSSGEAKKVCFARRRTLEGATDGDNVISSGGVTGVGASGSQGEWRVRSLMRSSLRCATNW